MVSLFYYYGMINIICVNSPTRIDPDVRVQCEKPSPYYVTYGRGDHDGGLENA